MKFNKWLLYFLISIPMTVGLYYVIKYKILVVFWSYMAVMGITGLIAEWNLFEENKSKLLVMIDHICMVCAITLFYWGAWVYFFGQGHATM